MATSSGIQLEALRVSEDFSCDLRISQSVVEDLAVVAARVLPHKVFCRCDVVCVLGTAILAVG